jgi:putative transposase
MSYEMQPGYKIRNQSGTHFLTFTIVGWMDIFTRQCYRDIIIDSFKFCKKNKDLRIGAYVIMSNHIHVIWTCGRSALSDTIRDFKTFTSKAIYESVMTEPESRRSWLDYMFRFYANQKAANRYHKLWTNNNHPEEIFSSDFMLRKLNYIHQNPVKAGWVSNAEDYLYSSAGDYGGRKGLIEIDFLL